MLKDKKYYSLLVSSKIQGDKIITVSKLCKKKNIKISFVFGSAKLRKFEPGAVL